jgi:hypothetical protein
VSEPWLCFGGVDGHRRLLRHAHALDNPPPSKASFDAVVDAACTGSFTLHFAGSTGALALSSRRSSRSCRKGIGLIDERGGFQRGARGIDGESHGEPSYPLDQEIECDPSRSTELGRRSHYRVPRPCSTRSVTAGTGAWFCGGTSISMQLNTILNRSPRQWRDALGAANEPVRAIDAERYWRVALAERRVTQTVACSRDRSGGIVEVV